MMRELLVLLLWPVLCLGFYDQDAPSISASTFGGGDLPIKRLHFTHVMKCGGTTLDSLLQVWSYNNQANFTTSESIRQERPSMLSSDIFYMVVIRNALDRVVSHYWQEKPWGKHPKTKSHPVCIEAATEGFAEFLKKCFFSSNYISRYFEPSSTIDGYVEQLARYNFVIPMEHLHEALVLMHLYNGFTVEDILYVNRKVFHNPKLTMTLAEEVTAYNLNQRDALIYDAAKIMWRQRYAALTSTSLFAAHLAAYNELQREYLQATDPHSICFSCGHTCSFRTQKSHRQLRSGVDIIPPAPLTCRFINVTTVASHKKQFCLDSVKCRSNNLLA